MELKDFIKGVLSDITEAIKESQEELDNGAIINPTSTSNIANMVEVGEERYRLHEVSFDVSVIAAESESSTKNGGINVKMAAGGASNENSHKEEHSSRIKFSVPLVYPSVHVEKYVHPEDRPRRGYTTYP